MNKYEMLKSAVSNYSQTVFKFSKLSEDLTDRCLNQ